MPTIYTAPEGFFVTTLSSDINASTSTIPLTAVPARITVGYMVIEPSSASKREVIHFTSVGATSVTTADDTTDASDATGRGCLGSITQGANTTHSQGAAVIISAVEQYWDRLYDNYTTEHNTDGTHKAATLNSIVTGTEATGDIIYASSASAWARLAIGATSNRPLVVVGGLPAWLTGDLDLPATGNIQLAGADPKRGFYVPASAMYPSTTAPCASLAQVESSTNDVNIKVLDFDGAGTSKEYAEFGLPSPSYWDASTVTATFYWYATAGSGTVNWEIQGLALSDDDALDTAYGTLQEVTDTLLATGDVHVTAETSAVTIAGTPVAGDWVMFKIARDPANDTNTSDARLMGVRIRFGIAQYNDT